MTKEGFQGESSTDIDPNLVKQYTQFIQFYNQFMANWQNAITTSIASETQQQPLASPTDSSSATTQQPSMVEMNNYISTLQQQLGLPLPQVTNSLPTEITSSQIQQLIDTLPQDPTPYNNALSWMNTQLQKSHANLGTALQGQPIEPFQDSCLRQPIEPFQDSCLRQPIEPFQDSCLDIAQCIANNPQIAQQIAQQQQQQSQQQSQQNQQELSQILQQFNLNQQLQTGLATNQDLIQKSQEIQSQAQSGELYKQINIPGAQTQTQYTLPPGATALSDLQREDPQKYNDYKQNYSQWFNIKSLIEQINGTL